jgi:hypothetical protein
VTPAIYTDQIMAKTGLLGRKRSPGRRWRRSTTTSSNQKVDGPLQGRLHQAGRSRPSTRHPTPTVKADHRVRLHRADLRHASPTRSRSPTGKSRPSRRPSPRPAEPKRSTSRDPKNQTYAWNANFISWVKAKTKAHIDRHPRKPPTHISVRLLPKREWSATSLASPTFRCCKSFFSTAFNANTFLTTQGLQIFV